MPKPTIRALTIANTSASIIRHAARMHKNQTTSVDKEQFVHIVYRNWVVGLMSMEGGDDVQTHLVWINAVWEDLIASQAVTA